MGQKTKRVAVTGGAGQIAYSLLFRLARGELFGSEQPLALHILEIPEVVEALKGVVMELEDCAFPLLQEVVIGSDPNVVFRDVDIAFLVGAKPRGKGMERGDLLRDNGRIFIEQGRALNEVASRDCLTLVVGNPANTNCWIAMTSAPGLPRQNFHSMMRLDQNRAVYQLASRAKAPLTAVDHMVVWGNHSSTQVPDFINARIGGKSVLEVIKDRRWLEGEFVQTIQDRGAAVIAARGKSSAGSAASAALDAMRSLVLPNPKGEWFSSGACSDGNTYGIAGDLIFSFPWIAKDRIVADVPWDEEYLRKKIVESERELLQERDAVRNLILA